CAAVRRDLPAFPSRRSSDLVVDGLVGQVEEILGGSAEAGDLVNDVVEDIAAAVEQVEDVLGGIAGEEIIAPVDEVTDQVVDIVGDRKSTRLNSSHVKISYAV